MFSQFFWFLRHVHKDWGWSLGFRLRSFCTSQIFLCCWCGILLSTSLLHFAHRTVCLFIALVCSSHLHMYNTFVKTYRSWIKTSAKAGCGAYLAATNIHKFSTYAISELFAILHALCLIYSLKLAKAGIRTDSLNSLQSITNWNYNRSQIALFNPFSYRLRGQVGLDSHPPDYPREWNSRPSGTFPRPTSVSSLETCQYPAEFFRYIFLYLPALCPSVGNPFITKPAQRVVVTKPLFQHCYSLPFWSRSNTPLLFFAYVLDTTK